MAVQQYNINPQVNGINGFGNLFCTTLYTTTLSANTDTTLTVPNSFPSGLPTSTTYNKFIAIFSYTAAKDVFVSLNNTAAVPVGNTFAASNSELNPTAKSVKG